MSKPVIYYGGLDMRSPEEKLQDEIDEMASYLDEQLSKAHEADICSERCPICLEAEREELDRQGYYDDAIKRRTK